MPAVRVAYLDLKGERMGATDDALREIGRIDIDGAWFARLRVIGDCELESPQELRHLKEEVTLGKMDSGADTSAGT
jgi:hypothetical protein